MTEKIITLRPHHVDRFVSYYHKFQNMFDKPKILEERYKKKMTKQLKDFFDDLALGGTGKEYILIKNGLDSICKMCPIKKENCSERDSLNKWNGSGQVMEDMNLKEGFLYTIEEFLEKVNQLYLYRNSKRQNNFLDS